MKKRIPYKLVVGRLSCKLTRMLGGKHRFVDGRCRCGRKQPSARKAKVTE